MVSVTPICLAAALAFLAVVSCSPVPEPSFHKGGHHVHHVIHVPEHHHTHYVHQVEKVPIYIKEKVFVHHHDYEDHHYDHHDHHDFHGPVYSEPIIYSSHGHGWDRK